MNGLTLYLMVGYPGSGKTTTAKIIHKLTGAVHLWADYERQKMFEKPEHSHQEHIKLYDELNQRTDELLRAGKSVIFDTNFNFYRDREYLRRIAARNGAHAVVIWITTPEAVARERATQRSENQATRIWGNMPAEAFNRIALNLEKPKQSEHVLELDGTHATEAYITEKLRSYALTQQA